jgi:glycosyltransferase involved in cell wall biosynthesis
MITYGHEKFIEQAINGVLMQQGDFELELILSNDCSPDNSDSVIQRILQNHPNASWINYVKQEENLGMMTNFIVAMRQCKGNYIALCDGDDYWTDPYKLQKQVDFLEANPEYVLSFHKVKILKPDGSLVDDFITKVPENYENQDTLARLGNYIHTPSVVFRNIIKELPKEFLLSPIGDYFLYMILSEHGKLKYIDEEMAVYRDGVGIHSTNSQIKMAKANFKLFTLLLSYSKNEVINEILLERQLSTLDYFEKLLRNEYSELFVSRHIIFKAIKSLKTPHKFWRKVKNKLNKK